MDKTKIINFLEGLTPGDFVRIITRMPEVSRHFSPFAVHYELVSDLVLYAQSTNGPGLEHLAQLLDQLFPDKGPFYEPAIEARRAGNPKQPARQQVSPVGASPLFMPSHFILPESFAEALLRDHDLNAAVHETLTDFGNWFATSRKPFFEDYTDHSITHINGILATADRLMTDDSKSLLSPGDFAVLILSILLHDAPLHLSEDGFDDLIRGTSRQNRIPGFDTATWADLWDDFLFLARRWDKQKKAEIFGYAANGMPRAEVRDPFESYDDLNSSSRKLIGEFLRWHHARLAHEFAIFGVPGPATDRIRLNHARLGEHLRDIAGLVARSHTLSIRRCTDYLQTRWGSSMNPMDIHAAFLMGIARITDYMEFQVNRSPKISFRYKCMWRKRSESEQRAYSAVTNLTFINNDPELVRMDAIPDDVFQFLQLKEWQTGIQAELDQSWAVIGEIYHSNPILKDLKLSLRRVRSNLDDATSIGNHATFVPDHFVFDISQPDILKLMVGPLYGDDPCYGIRELLQNALDAVRERIVFQQHHPDTQTASLRALSADVVLSIGDPDESGSATITVEDQGIGMNESTIKDYFLRVGSSYRNSETWQKEFEVTTPNIMPGQGRSTVIRTGKFGVGSLAAFLLTDEIEVETRHIKSPYGLRFKARLTGDAIEIRKDPALCVGTRIRFVTNKETIERITQKEYEGLRWYYGTTPKLITEVGASCKKVEPAWYWYIPEAGTIPADWLPLPANDFSRVLWTYRRPQGRGLPLSIWDAPLHDSSEQAIQNGLFVGNLHWKQDHDWQICLPSISVDDPDSILPIDMRRNNLDLDKISFLESLLDDIICFVFAILLIEIPDTPFVLPSEKLQWLLKKFVDISSFNILAVASRGVCLNDEDCLRYFKPSRIFVIGNAAYRDNFVKILKLTISDIVISKSEYQHSYYLSDSDLSESSILPKYICKDRWIMQGMRVLFNNGEHKYHDIARSLGLSYTTDQINEFSQCPPTNFAKDFADTGMIFSELPPSILEMYPLDSTVHPADSRVAKLWKQIIRQPLIPFSPQERRDQLKHSYEILDKYIVAYQAMKQRWGN